MTAESQPGRIKPQTKSVPDTLVRLRGQKSETKYDSFDGMWAENLVRRSLLPDDVVFIGKAKLARTATG